MKQFSLLLYLGLRRTDGSDGWVDLRELVARVPHWRHRSADEAGRVVHRMSTYPWFRVVEYERPTRGRYRLIPFTVFLPDRDAADTFIASAMPHRRGTGRRPRFSPTELQAYDLLIQHGVYLPAVVDLVLQRVGNPERLAAEERLAAYRILVTLHKTRGDTKRARSLAEKGLRFARRRRAKDDIGYLLGQIGGAYFIEDKAERARRYFQEEVDFYRSWGTKRAAFHLVGAHRNLAAALRVLERPAEAREALAESKRYAEESGNEEGLHLARLVEANVQGDGLSSLATILSTLPVGHLVAHVMALNAVAESLLQQGHRSEGEALLRFAYREGEKLGLKHEMEKSRTTAERFGIPLRDVRAS